MDCRRTGRCCSSSPARRAITEVFGSRAAVQRCQVHKCRNVLGHLPERLHASVSKALRDAWDLDSADRAARVLERLARSLASALLRRAAGGALVEAEKHFRRVRGYRDVPHLVNSSGCAGPCDGVVSARRLPRRRRLPGAVAPLRPSSSRPRRLRPCQPPVHELASRRLDPVQLEHPLRNLHAADSSAVPAAAGTGTSFISIAKGAVAQRTRESPESDRPYSTGPASFPEPERTRSQHRRPYQTRPPSTPRPQRTRSVARADP